METVADDRRLDELAEVHRRRYTEARQAGLEHQDAIRYARSGADIGQLRKLVEAGCPPKTLRAIVL